jgi:cobalt-zinc-cadmium efflux system protein
LSDPHHHQHAAHERQHGHHHHAHGHGHQHAHPGAASDHNRAFMLAVILNVAFVAIEFGYGFVAHSTALMADAGHNLSDVLGLLLAWGAALLARRQPEGRYTYGLRSSSILAALANAMLLLVACGGIAWEALRRLLEPSEVAAMTVVWVAAAGIVINGFSAWLFMAGSKHDLNLRGAFMHMAADALISLGVVIGGIVILNTGWSWIDPALSLAIVVVIVIGTWGLLRESVNLSLSAVPRHIDLPAVQHYLNGLKGVDAVHDLHIWGMSTTESALTACLVMPAGHAGDGFMDEVADQLKQRFAIQHCTLEIRAHAGGSHCTLEHG